MRVLFRIVIVLLLTAGAGAESFHFSFVSRIATYSGTLYGYPVSPGVYQITGLTGTVNPGQEYGLDQLNYVYPGEFSSKHYNDNLLFANEPYVDSFGISFFAGNTVYYSMIHDQLGYALLTCGGDCSSFDRRPGELEVSIVPEPPSLLLMGIGIALLGTQIKGMRFGRV